MALRPLLDGLRFAECPRWHDGRLWFSDIFAHRVMTVTEDGSAAVVESFDDGTLPSGLGFLPDGRLLVVDMHSPRILRREAPGQLVVHADLTDLAVGALNDMVVDRHGRAYVGAMGTNPASMPRPLAGDGNVIRVDPDGSARVVADGMDAPNGPCITDDGGRYVVAEFPAGRLMGFDVLPNGSLENRRIWADLRPGSADGICVDSADGVWTASPRESECRRVLEGGEITDTVAVPGRLPLACCLGGGDGRTLFVLSAVGGEAAVAARTSTSVIETVRVAIPGRTV